MPVKISKARFTLSPFSSEQMLQVGNALTKAIRERMESGQNANDQQAKPLKGPTKGNYLPYATIKQERGLQGIRNWLWSGRTLRTMGVISVNQNRGVIGFKDARADRILHFNNKIEKAFGVSPKDRTTLTKAVYDLFSTSKLIDFRKV